MMRGRFAVLRSNYYIYFVPSHISVYLVSLNSKKNELLGHSIHVNIGKQLMKGGSRKTKNRFSYFYFFNYDITVNNCVPGIKFHRHIENILLEGTMSQICYIGPSFYFMNSRKIIMKK